MEITEDETRKMENFWMESLMTTIENDWKNLKLISEDSNGRKLDWKAIEKLLEIKFLTLEMYEFNYIYY